jgi:hypothetical protein
MPRCRLAYIYTNKQFFYLSNVTLPQHAIRQRAVWRALLETGRQDVWRFVSVSLATKRRTKVLTSGTIVKGHSVFHLNLLKYLQFRNNFVHRLCELRLMILEQKMLITALILKCDTGSIYCIYYHNVIF